ncbi:insulinase family protein [Patescibacteria group bacterium]|nr:insulinase family protein [Patescibacteria group bacterium]
MHKHEIITLKNGLRLVVVPMKGVESVTVMIGAGVGSRYETEKIRGISHFLEHMAFKGTIKRPKPIDISSEVDQVGGNFNAFTGKEFTGFWIKASSKHLELGFDILSDMLKNSLFDKGEIEKEKKVIIEEIRMYEDLPMAKVGWNFEKLIFGKTPLGEVITGTEKTVASILRKDFLDYINKFYYPSNLVLCAAGKVNSVDVERFAKKYFDIKEHKKIKTYVSQEILQTEPKLDIFFKKTEQAHLVLGAPAYSYSHPKRYTSLVLAAVLGGGMSSRLFSELRGKHGLGYYVRCDSENYSDTGYIEADAGVDVNRIDLAIKLILNEFEKTVQKRVSDKELKKTKEMIKGRFLLGLESSSAVSESYCRKLSLEGRIKTPQEILKIIDGVGSDDVQGVAKETFTKNKMNLAVIGPYKDKSRFKKLLEA